VVRGVLRALRTTCHVPDTLTAYPLLATLVVALATALRLFALDRLPPGLYYDESANGVDALRVLAGAHPVFFAGDQGREPLMIYLQAAAVAVLGPSPLALRLPSAIVGILTVAATFAAVRALFGSRVGLFASFLLAVSFWHLSLSRLAFRAVALPLFTTLALFWLWKGLRGGRARHFAVAGVLLGIDLYTYLPARLAPALFGLWFLGFLVIPAWRTGARRKQLAAGGLVATALFLVTLLPLAQYFSLHPTEMMGRIDAERQDTPGATVAEGFARSLEALVWKGDPNPRQNLPGRPLLDLPVALAAALGVIVALRRWRDGASLFILASALAMLAPAALSQEPWHALRLAGDLPFVLILAALGFDWVVRVARPAGRAAGSLAVVLLFIVVGFSTMRDYFVVWAESPATYDAFESGALHATALLSQVPAGDTAFAASETYEGMPIPLSFAPRTPTRVRSFDGRNTFVTPGNAAQPAYYDYAQIYLPDGGIPDADQLRLVATSRDASGRVVGQLFRLPAPLVPPSPSRATGGMIASAVKLTGVEVPSVVRPGQPLRFSLYWTVVGRLPPGDWSFFAHLVERSQQQLLGQDYNQGFAPDQWRNGDRVVTSFTIRVPPETPAAVADVDTGLFNQATGERLSLTDSNGKPAGTVLKSGPVRIDRPAPIAAATHPLAAQFGSSIALRGYDLARTDDGQVTLRLHWQAEHVVDRDYTVFVHLVDDQGRVIAGADGEPGGGAFPTSTWVVGEEVPDEHRLRLPSPLPPGAHVEVGLYLLSTGQRLPVVGIDGSAAGDSVTIPL